MKQLIPAGGFTGSDSGGLHASSVGKLYPWSVQPRLVDRKVRWVAFNAHTGYTSATWLCYESALAVVLALRADDAATKGRTMENVRR